MRIGTLKESYIADAALYDSRTQRIWLAMAGALGRQHAHDPIDYAAD